MNIKFNFKISNILYFIISFFLIIGLYLNYKFLNLNFYNQSMDTAGMADLINNIANDNGSTSSLWSSVRSFRVILGNIDLICIDKFRNASNFDFDVIKNHSWYASYLLGFFIKFGFGANFLVNILTLLSYSLSIFLILFYFLKNNINPILALSFLILLVANPIFAEALYGQRYFSKLSIFPCLLFLFLYNYKNNDFHKFYILVFLVIFLSLFHERTSLFIGVFLLFDFFIKILEKQRIKNEDLIFLILSIYCLLIFFKTMYYTETPAKHAYDYDSFIRNFAYSFLNQDYQLKIMKMFFVIFPLLFFCFFSGKHFILIIIFLIPNIILNVGGSEKIGWSIHYHSYLSPYLFYYAATGFKVFLDKFSRISSTKVIFLPLVLLTAHSLFVEPHNYKNIFNYQDIVENKLLKNLKFSSNKNNLDLLNKHIEKKKTFFSIIPNTSSISMRENHSVYFAAKDYKKISFFPIWIGNSDYLIVDQVLENNEFQVYIDKFSPKMIAPFYNNGSNAKDCINSYILKTYKEIDRMDTSIQTRTIIYKKNLN